MFAEPTIEPLVVAPSVFAAFGEIVTTIVPVVEPSCSAVLAEMVTGRAFHIEELAPDVQIKAQELFDKALEAGYELRFVSGRRSCAEQNNLYASGRTKDGPIVTKARGCNSWHVMGRAIDFEFADRKNPSKREDYEFIGDLAKSLGWKWGGDFPGFPDMVHVEYHPGKSIADFCPDPDNCSSAYDTSVSMDLRPEEEQNPPPPETDETYSSSSSSTAFWLLAGTAVVAALGFAVLQSTPAPRVAMA
jgi:peptidoglycan L-alanyl-D-glutamate endopeptidase CwlK